MDDICRPNIGAGIFSRYHLVKVPNMARTRHTTRDSLLPNAERPLDVARAYLIRHCTSGGPVSERELSEKLNQSRSATQRILSVLEGEGLVTVEARVGTRAVVIPREDIVALLRIRRAVEIDICTSLARNDKRDLSRTKEIVAAMKEIANAGQNSDDERFRFNELDCAFHESLALAAENVPAAALLRNIRARHALVAIAALRTQEEMHDVNAEHRALIAAIEKKPKRAALEAIESGVDIHLANTAKRWYPQFLRNPQ